jgi:hypothetical protein
MHLVGFYYKKKTSIYTYEYLETFFFNFFKPVILQLISSNTFYALI